MTDSSIFMPGTQAMFEVPLLLNSKCHTFFRGCKEYEYIILDYPCKTDGIPLFLEEYMKCIVRFLFQGKVYAFESEIRKTVKYPYPFVFISYPEKMDNINLRSSERYAIRLPAFYNQQALEDTLEKNPAGLLLDLSEKGCLLETGRPLEVETHISLAFALPNQTMIKNLAAKVKSISRKDETYRLGLIFMVSEHPDIEKIREYLSYLGGLQIQT